MGKMKLRKNKGPHIGIREPIISSYEVIVVPPVTDCTRKRGQGISKSLRSFNMFVHDAVMRSNESI